MDISSPVGGGKFKQFVRDIINAERQPIRQIEARKNKEKERLKLIQEFSARVRKIPDTLKELNTFKKFREVKADWSAKDQVNVTLDKNLVQTGEYQVEILQLAGRHSLMSSGYESPDDRIGVGYFTYEMPNGETKSVWIGDDEATLKGLVDSINRERDLGVQASLINDGSDSETPWRVVVHAKKSGIQNDLIYPDFYFLDGDFRFLSDDERPAQNAIIKFNGFEIMSPSNKFDLLPGMTLDLKEAKEGREFTIAVTEDVGSISGKVKALVDGINGVLEFVNQQNKLDAESDTSKTLGGDTALVTIESRIRRLAFEPFYVGGEDEGEMMRLSDLGIEFQRDGKLAFKEDRFQKQVLTNFDKISTFFAGDGNFAERLQWITDGFLRPETGAVTSRERGIKDRIRAMDENIAQKERHLEKREQQLKRQFSQLEGLLGSMQSQQAYVQQALGSSMVPPGSAGPGM